ncbi:MAG: AEC family transporter [Planctomycetota bacterium]
MFESDQFQLFLKILLATIPVFIMVAAGSLCRVLKIVTETSEKSLMRIVLLVLYPCFILSKIPGNDQLRSGLNVVWALGCGAGLTLAGLGVVYLVGKVLKVEAGKTQRTFCLATAIQNYGFLPMPLLIALFPEMNSKLLGVLFVHNLGLELVLWSVGIIIISGSSRGTWKRLINGPSVAITLGLLLNFTGWFHYIPAPVNEAIAQLGNCTIPVSLLLVGASLAGVLLNESWKVDWRVISGSLIARFLIMPVLFLGVAFLCSSFEPLMLILVIEAAMPTAVFPIVIAKHFGGKPSVAVQVCVATSIASLLLTPLWLTLGLWLLGVEVG